MGDYVTIDQRIKTLTKDDKMTIPELVKTITPGYATTELKARAVYDWISLNIRYDDAKLYNGNPLEYQSDPEKILQQKKGICSEFTTLARSMFTEAGIPCEIINGNALDCQTHVLTGHSWNAIQLAGKWQLIDVTWAANESLETGNISNAYYLVPPDHFILTHLPDEKKWSFLDSIPSIREFADHPIVDGNYFFYAEKPYPTHRMIVATNGELQLRRFLKAEFEEILDLYKDGKLFAVIKNGKISGLEKGEYELVVGVNHQPDQKGELSYILGLVTFQVIVP